MYETIFSLAKRPFLAAPCTDRYFAAAPIESARHTLARGIERAEGPGLLIGPAGSGKSLICQLLAEQFAATFNVVLLSTTRLCTPRALLQNILFELRLPFRDLEEGELRLNLIDFLQRSEKSPNGMLLLVDEANTLPLRLLEEIRMITNVVRDGIPRVRLVLAGGPQLEERFASPRLESLNQRIAARCYLQSMTREETAQYVRHQIGLSGGGGGSLFNEDALRAVFHATDGVPRLVNQVCDHALMLAAAAGHKTLTPASIEEAWADLQQLPTPSLAIEASIDTDSAADEADMIEFGQLDDEPAEDLVQQIELESDFEPAPIADVSEHESEPGEVDCIACCETEVSAVDLTAGVAEGQVQSADPFGHHFEEEEVILDRYAALDSAKCEAPSDPNHEGQPEANEVAAEMTETAAHVTCGGEPDTTDSPTNENIETGTESESTIEFEPAVAGLANETPVEPQVVALDEQPCSTECATEDTTTSDESEDSQITIHCIGAKTPDVLALPEDDRDMIIVEEEPGFEDGVAEPVGPRVRRREYRHLFAKLRQS